mmetsp:Transcript_19565/g.54402  ORF Transcript_19565/g.54402 Transcript_19565/m.54402 type:complete len:249 (+) Transcript_19565:3319-4065(+)
MDPLVKGTLGRPVDAHTDARPLENKVAAGVIHLLAAGELEYGPGPLDLQQAILNSHAEVDGIKHIPKSHAESVPLCDDLIAPVAADGLAHHLVMNVLDLSEALHTGSCHLGGVHQVCRHKGQILAHPDGGAAEPVLVGRLLQGQHQRPDHGCMLHILASTPVLGRVPSLHQDKHQPETSNYNHAERHNCCHNSLFATHNALVYEQNRFTHDGNAWGVCILRTHPCPVDGLDADVKLRAHVRLFREDGP